MKEFLQELEKLCKNYEATIWGCGCCNSPSVEIGEEHELDVQVEKGVLTIKGVKFSEQ